MSTLRSLIQEATALQAGSRDPKDSLFIAAENWRRYVREGDGLLEAVEGVVEAVHSALASKDPVKRKANIADISGELREVAAAGSKSYKWFASGRDAVYEAAVALEIETKRKSVGNKPKPLAGLSKDDLLTELDALASELAKGMGGVLEDGAAVSKKLRLVATGTEELNPENAEKLIGNCLDFRDQVSAYCFALVNGMMRRAVELSNRAWSEMRMEDVAADWRAPWASDPELGDREL